MPHYGDNGEWRERHPSAGSGRADAKGATLKRPLEGVFSVPGARSTLNEAVEGGTRKGHLKLLLGRAHMLGVVWWRVRARPR